MSSQPPPDAICDTTVIRYFAIVGMFDDLVRILGGRVSVPRHVLDLDEDPNGPVSRLSEIGRTERHFPKRSREPENCRVTAESLRCVRGQT